MPIFKPELIDKIVRDEKTQTRRPMKVGEVLRRIESPHGGYVPLGVYQNNRAKMLVGHDYAVVPGRGKQCVWWQPEAQTLLSSEEYLKVREAQGEMYKLSLVQIGYRFLRIRVLDIRCEDVRKISLEDAMAEGFYTRNEFWEVWCSFYDVPGLKIIAAHKPHNVIVQAGLLQDRPDELYQAWAYTFEVVR